MYKPRDSNSFNGLKCCIGYRHWRGKIGNSYFANRLFLTTLFLFLCNIIAITSTYLTPSCFPTLKYIHYISLSNVILSLCIFYRRTFRLYTHHGLRVIRTPYLHVCELFVLFAFIGLIAFPIQGLLVVLQEDVQECMNYENGYHILLAVLVWVLMYSQLFAFCRFRTHLKLQMNSGRDKKHSANIQGCWRVFLTRPHLTSNARRIESIRSGLFKAVSKGDVYTTRTLLDQAAEVVGRDRCFATEWYSKCPIFWFGLFLTSNKNPLHVAASLGHGQLVQMLLDAGFDPNALDKVDRANFSFSQLFKLTHLFVATQDRVRISLRDVLSPTLLTPLHCSSIHGHIEVIKQLLDHGADVEMSTKTSLCFRGAHITSLFLSDNPNVVEILLRAGANPLVVCSGLRGNSKTVTVLQFNLSQSTSAISTVLENWGADVALSPLHTAAGNGNVTAVMKFLKAGVNIESRGEGVVSFNKRTPLHWAAIAGMENTVQILLEANASPNARDARGRTPLHWAVRNNRTEVVKILLASGSDANARDGDEYPPLLLAAEMEIVTEDIFLLLLSYGADINASISMGQTALHLALLHDNREAGLVLLRLGADIMKKDHSGQRALECTTSTEIQFAMKRQAGHRDVMISYTHAHSVLAVKVREAVEAEGITCWMDTMDPNGISGGSIWREAIAQGIYHANAVLAIVSGKYGKSEWCLKELAYAKLMKKDIIALIVEEAALTSSVEVRFSVYSYFIYAHLLLGLYPS